MWSSVFQLQERQSSPATLKLPFCDRLKELILNVSLKEEAGNAGEQPVSNKG